MNPGRCISITCTFEDNSTRVYNRKDDNYILMAESIAYGYRNMSMAGGVERRIAMLKLIDHTITQELLGVNIIGPDAAKEKL